MLGVTQALLNSARKNLLALAIPAVEIEFLSIFLNRNLRTCCRERCCCITCTGSSSLPSSIRLQKGFFSLLFSPKAPKSIWRRKLSPVGAAGSCVCSKPGSERAGTTEPPARSQNCSGAGGGDERPGPGKCSSPWHEGMAWA